MGALAMRVSRYLLAISLLLALPLAGLTTAATQAVPTDAPAYTQLRQLSKANLLSTAGETLLSGIPPRMLSRGEFTAALIEPLERLTALVAAQDTPGLVSPPQRRQQELAYRAVSSLTASEFEVLRTTAAALLRTFAADIEDASPGLPARATTALGKLAQPRYRPWMRAVDQPAGIRPSYTFSLNPRVVPDSLRDPLPLLPSRASGHDVLFMKSADVTADTAAVGTRPLNSMQAAMDFAFGRWRLYGSVASLPGQVPSLVLRAGGTGKAMLGVQFDIGRMSDIGITGIVEYHIVRSGDPATSNVDTGALTGIGLSW